MNLEEATQLRDTIQSSLTGYHAYCKISPAADEAYQVVVVQQGAILPKLPEGIKVIVDPTFEPISSEGMDLEKPQSLTNRTTELPEEIRWRNREIQDLVKRVATMSTINNIVRGIEVLALGRDSRIDSLLESLQSDLMLSGLKATNPLVRLLNKVQKSYKEDLADALVASLKAKYPEASDFIIKAKHIHKLINEVGDISPDDNKKVDIAKEASQLLREVDVLCMKLTTKMKQLDLAEEAHQLKAMSGAAKDIFKAVSKQIG
jgi:hypothetical protein